MLHIVKLLLHFCYKLVRFWSQRRFLSHSEVLPVLIVDDPASLSSVEAGRAGDELGHVEREEAVAVETARVPLRQHEGFSDVPFGVDVAEIGPREESVVSSGTQYEPA